MTPASALTQNAALRGPETPTEAIRNLRTFSGLRKRLGLPEPSWRDRVYREMTAKWERRDREVAR